jgi:hypothetical protein
MRRFRPACGLDAPPIGQVDQTFKKAPRKGEEHEHLTLAVND